MHSLFSQAQAGASGIVHIPEWQYIKSGLIRNLNIVLDYYRKNPIAVHSEHFLVNLIQSITIPQTQNLERYYPNVDDMSLDLSMALKMTSSIYQGKIFDGIFYGKGNDEILIAHNESFNPFKANKNWKNLAPVKFLRHYKSDFSFDLPNGNKLGSEEGLSVIAINIPMLALQYRAFRYNELAIEDENESTLSCAHFVHMYVLPNMLWSYIDHAVFNRISNLEFGIPLGEGSHKHPFFLTDYTDKSVYAQNAILNNLKKQSRTFDGYLQNIPTVIKDNACKLMELPDLPLTRQLLWAMVMSRIPELQFLFRISKDSIGQKNQSEINRITRYVLNYKQDNVFRQNLPLNQFTELMDDLEEMINK